jgi:hypothetical protein
MKVSDVFANQETIRAADIGAKEFRLVIAAVERKTLDDGVTKLVLSFQNAKKRMVANKINAKRIALMHGEHRQTKGNA